nr:MAG TPA: hypothetical protein [Caudoviricetes sp.]
MSATKGEATRKPAETWRDRRADRAARPADTRVQVPGGHETQRNARAGEDPTDRRPR